MAVIIRIFIFIIVKWLLSYIQFIDWFFICLDLFIVFFNLNYCSVYVCGCLFKNCLLYLFVKCLFSYITFIDWFSTCLDLYVVLFIWIIVGGMIVAVYQEVIAFYNCDMSIISYPVHWLILYLLRSVCCFFLFELL